MINVRRVVSQIQCEFDDFMLTHNTQTLAMKARIMHDAAMVPTRGYITIVLPVNLRAATGTGVSLESVDGQTFLSVNGNSSRFPTLS